jgi:hypothetical protein
MTTNLPPAGWFPDPKFPGQQRWWDGTGWTEHRQPDPEPQSEARRYAAAPQQVAGPGVQQAERLAPVYNSWDPKEDAKRSKNSFATSAIILAVLAPIVSLAGSPWIGAVVAIGAIVFGVLSRKRSRDMGRGNKRGMAGIVVGAIAVPLALVVGFAAQGGGTPQTGTQPQTARQDSATYDVKALEAEIKAELLKQNDGVKIKSVECPDSPTIKEDSSFECLVNVKGQKTPTIVEVRIQDDAGHYIWEVKN